MLETVIERPKSFIGGNNLAERMLHRYNLSSVAIGSDLVFKKLGLTKRYFVPRVGFCYDDICKVCEYGDKCHFKHREKGQSVKAVTGFQEDRMCIICGEGILKKDQMVGILDCCSHDFCLPCIDTWAKTKRGEEFKCPMCRKEPGNVVPSRRFLVSEEERSAHFKIQREMVRYRLCENEKGAFLFCPRRDVCWYRHRKQQATPVESYSLEFL